MMREAPEGVEGAGAPTLDEAVEGQDLSLPTPSVQVFYVLVPNRQILKVLAAMTGDDVFFSRHLQC